MILTTLTTMAQATTELAGPPPPSGGFGILDMVLHAGPMVQAVMAGLLGLSLISWGIIITKSSQLRKVIRESETFADFFMKLKSIDLLQKECEKLHDGHLAHIFRIGCAELNRVSQLLSGRGMEIPGKHADLLLENVDRAIQSGLISKRKRLQRLLPFLATTGSTAPFIGLFGTVWGIMTSFRDIGMKGSANLAVVAPGISEALVATAMGLAAAIPAVVFYNHFSNMIQLIEDDMLQFTSEFVNRLKTDLVFRRGQGEEASGPADIAGERRGPCGCMEVNRAQVR